MEGKYKYITAFLILCLLYIASFVPRDIPLFKKTASLILHKITTSTTFQKLPPYSTTAPLFQEEKLISLYKRDFSSSFYFQLFNLSLIVLLTRNCKFSRFILFISIFEYNSEIGDNFTTK